VRWWSEEFERRAAEMRQRNEHEQLVPRIGHDQLRIAAMVGVNAAMERHYTVQEIGEVWNLDPSIASRSPELRHTPHRDTQVAGLRFSFSPSGGR